MWLPLSFKHVGRWHSFAVFHIFLLDTAICCLIWPSGSIMRYLAFMQIRQQEAHGYIRWLGVVVSAGWRQALYCLLLRNNNVSVRWVNKIVRLVFISDTYIAFTLCVCDSFILTPSGALIFKLKLVTLILTIPFRVLLTLQKPVLYITGNKI